ncbi:MAG: N-acetyltransferase [Actinomycetales bacterium]|nr:MAG: N-acetyltransferase [Actinomycetales bacterium]
MTAPHLADVTWPRRTERLVVRPYREEDLGAVWAYRSDPDVARWVGRAPRTREDLATGFVARPGEPALVAEHDGVVMADLMVRVGDGWSQADVRDGAARTEAELGWVLAPSHHGLGLGSEAVTDLLDLCFGELGLRRVTAGCFVENAPSWRLMERLGMRREAHGVRDSLHRDLGWVDGYTYAILADEWTARRGG